MKEKKKVLLLFRIFSVGVFSQSEKTRLCQKRKSQKTTEKTSVFFLLLVFFIL